ncbi:RNA polymerase, sigma-24 subunit, ECF subfamily [Opitutus terrae PB90-1]|uniref:RNA polymerase, sigma-24 subunit, ECF subfamily n=1 Tax=Opitutus terrae (strain DSM 11246 / JCM 15787 / PB90-1) TaxID=452637 RepID=B1ZRL4_OPITP|nr:RNA polymerase, sigma-24 subunit, ECF subfamily [Opitutus terrae PB90-1]
MLKPGIHRRLSAADVDRLLAHRAAFHGLLTQQLGCPVAAEDLMQGSLAAALNRCDSMRRGESMVGWFYRVLGLAVTNRTSGSPAAGGRMQRLRQKAGTHRAISTELDTVVGGCFQCVLGALRPRYAEAIRRIDLRGEPAVLVAHEMGISVPTLCVVLHRARIALRRHLAFVCEGSLGGRPSVANAPKGSEVRAK